MDVIAAILNRRSPGRLSEPGPNSVQLEQILVAAAHAPDHGRLSPWRFAVMQGTSREILANALQAQLLHTHADATAEMIAAERAKAHRAPVIVAVTAHVTPGHKVPEIEQIIAVGAAVENMLLAAWSLGFGSLWKTGAPSYQRDVKTALGFLATDHIVGFIYLGTAAAPAKPRNFSLTGLVRHL